MATYLLDTSAWLAHVFGEPGADQVTTLFEDPDATIALSAPSILEAHARFQARGRLDEFEEMLEMYRQLLSRIYPIDESVALRAVALRQRSTTRVPAIDTLIAATAAYHNATLVHRDPHFAGLPEGQPTQLVLQAAA